MPDNVTIELCIKKLEDLLKVAHKCHFDVIASLLTTEAEVILAALKEKYPQ